MSLREMERTPVRFSAEHYLRLDIEGRTELLGGVIYRVSPRNEPHSYAVSVLARLLIRGLGDDYAVRIQDHVAVSDWRGKNAPEIDVACSDRASTNRDRPSLRPTPSSKSPTRRMVAGWATETTRSHATFAPACQRGSSTSQRVRSSAIHRSTTLPYRTAVSRASPRRSIFWASPSPCVTSSEADAPNGTSLYRKSGRAKSSSANGITATSPWTAWIASMKTLALPTSTTNGSGAKYAAVVARTASPSVASICGT